MTNEATPAVTETVDEILNTEITEAQVKAALKFLESFPYTATAIFALEQAMRANWTDPDTDACPCADVLHPIVTLMAETEAPLI